MFSASSHRPARKDRARTEFGRRHLTFLSGVAKASVFRKKSTD